ncbi:hypothetical protein WMY93_009045 [Mugilogobius chulae]|uniref:Cilia-and flagella-associated protein 96 n=1 Tax=Mugilogobius chulae TaxID=88201 RepID=A0AAW0PAB1_9GOBI
MAFPEGKSDMERLGIFKEMGYISIGDKYSPPNNHIRRIFEREALNDPIKLARQYRNQQAKKILGKAFLPSNGIKTPCGSGSYYGTLSGPVEAMSPQTLPRKPHNYPNVGLSSIDLYASDPYDRAKESIKKEVLIHRSKVKAGPFMLNLHPKDFFQDNPYRNNKPTPSHTRHSLLLRKCPQLHSSPHLQIGGMKAGTFDNYPSHSADPYTIRRSKSTHQGLVFHPAPGPKSTPVKSIIMHNVNRSVHSANYSSKISVMSMSF